MIFDINGSELFNAFAKDASPLDYAFDVTGNIVFEPDAEQLDYTQYSYTEVWGEKNIPASQGFDIYDGKVFWVAKMGNDSIPANCYVWNLSDGSQAFSDPYVTIYSGHGNNLSFHPPHVYISHAYPYPTASSVYINNVSDDLQTFTLEKTLTFNDGTEDLDCCLDEYNLNRLWTLGHISEESTTWIVSKWNLANLTINGDGTYTPELLQTAYTAQPETNRNFQGIRHHDGMIWYCNGNGAQRAHVYAINPTTGERLYEIDLETNAEPEGLVWRREQNAPGGWALYVGFQRMALRRYTFELLEDESEVTA